VIVGAIGFRYLRSLPGGPTSHLLELAGLDVGPRLRARLDPALPGRQGRARPAHHHRRGPYAALWLAALAACLGFACRSSHWFHGELVSFSVANHVPAAAYATAFVLMVLTMVAVRTAAVLVRSGRIGAC
jgi:hypothetical protein